MDVRSLDTGNAALIEFIHERIRTGGPVTFAWFMEQALYHPEHGYYSSRCAAIGRYGDYFTNVSVGPLFGRLMATQFEEMWRALGEPAEFTIVEQGAHDGQFACDVLTAIDRQPSGFRKAARYEIIESFAPLRNRQSEVLASFGARVTWTDSLTELQPFCGVHFSNELLDAMPVRIVRWDGDQWLERYVTQRDGAFESIDQPVSDRELSDRLGELPTTCASGYETEVNLAASTWVDEVAQKLARGFVVAADYGFARDEFYAPHRGTGTLQCRSRHAVVASPLIDVGNADITAHVEWTSLAERAQSAGLDLLGFTDQHHFLTGLLNGPAAAELSEPMDPKNARALQTLLHPAFLGMKFQFLVLGKGVEQSPRLAGLRFAKDAHVALALSS